MKAVERDLIPHLRLAAKSFPATVITGPRRSGKTYLLRHLFPKAEYYLFEDPDIISRFREDPQGFLDGVKPPVILDEIQNLPEVFNYVRSRIDAQPRKMGQWFLTGSQEAGLMQNVTESMAGRAAVLQLLPLSLHESPKVSHCSAGTPKYWRNPRPRSSGSALTFRPTWNGMSALSPPCRTSVPFAASCPCSPHVMGRCSTRPTSPRHSA